MATSTYLFPFPVISVMAFAGKKTSKKDDQEETLESDEETDETDEETEGEGEESEFEQFDFTDAPAESEKPFQDEEEWQKQDEGSANDDLESML